MTATTQPTTNTTTSVTTTATNGASQTVVNSNLQNDIKSVVDAFRNSDEDLKEEEGRPHPQQKQQPSRKVDVSKLKEKESKVDQRTSKPFHFVPLKMGGDSGRTHVVSKESQQLIQQEVTIQDLTKMTSLFYEKVFQDPVLDKFIRDRDDPHGERFAKWIHQKLSGSKIWDEDRYHHRNLEPVTLANNIQHIVHDRSSAHAAAWYSPKRPVEDVGRHFQLDECRVWMRLHFWALRESGLMEKSPSFADYYIRFIGHFVRVYESTAQQFTRDSFRWSANPNNITRYIQNGRRMNDVMNLSLKVARLQIPQSEANDTVWPYHKEQLEMTK